MPKHAAVRGPKPLHTPHDRNQIINRAPPPTWINGWRDRIKVTKLIDRLQTFALDDPDTPTGPRLTRTQATVALGLLAKVLPNVQSLEVSGNSDKPITVSVLRFSDPDDPAANTGNPAVGGTTPMLSSPGEPLTIDITPRLIEDEPPVRKPRKSATSRGTRSR